MGKMARKVIEHTSKKDWKPRFKKQDGSQASPESLPRQKCQKDLMQGSHLNNSNIDTKGKSPMNDKLMIQCPHCTKAIESERLVSQRKYRNDFGLDIFECPGCYKNYKIEPREYLAARDNIEKENSPDTRIIKAAKVDDILLSEKMAINYERRSRAPWRGSAKIIAVIAFLILAFIILLN